MARSLFPPATLQQALDRLGFVQADPIRAPARAQDLTLRHRVTGYRAGDLERQLHAARRPRRLLRELRLRHRHRLGADASARRSDAVVRGARPPGAHAARLRAIARRVHPREVDEHFALGTVTNYWGGSSSATTHLLDQMHYRGLLRVVRRDAGIRVYAAHEHDAAARDAATRRTRLDALVDVDRREVRAAHGVGIEPAREAAPLRGAAVVDPARSRRGARPSPPRARAGRRRELVLAGPREPRGGHRRRGCAPAGAVRSGRVGSSAVRAALEVGISLRGVHAGAEAKAGLLRAPAPLARPDRGLGQRRHRRRRNPARVRLCRGRPPRERGFRAALDEELQRLAASLVREP